MLAAPWVQLSVSAGNRWPHNALRHHWLMPISCHFRDCKALLVTRLTHVSGAMASVQIFTFTFTMVWQRLRYFIQLPTCLRDCKHNDDVIAFVIASNITQLSSLHDHTEYLDKDFFQIHQKIHLPASSHFCVTLCASSIYPRPAICSAHDNASLITPPRLSKICNRSFCHFVIVNRSVCEQE